MRFHLPTLTALLALLPFLALASPLPARMTAIHKSQLKTTGKWAGNGLSLAMDFIPGGNFAKLGGKGLAMGGKFAAKAFTGWRRVHHRA